MPGEAQLRTPGHHPAFVLPPQDYESAVGAFGAGGEQGMTVNRPGVIGWLLSRGNPANRAIYSSGMAAPTVVLPQDFSHATAQHEATHALMGGAKAPDADRVNALLPAEARASLGRFYKTPESMAAEVPARAVTEPESLQLDRAGTGPHSGATVRAQYLDLLSGSDPAAAANLTRLWNRQAIPQ